MKAFFISLLTISLAGCASTPPSQTALIFSGSFALSVPSVMLEGASLLSIDGLTLRTKDGATLTGTLITHSSESLPQSLDLRAYPKLVIATKEAPSLASPTQELLAGIRAEVDHSYGLQNLAVFESSTSIIYRLCKQKKCLGYITKAGVGDHLWMIHADGFEETEFDELLKEL